MKKIILKIDDMTCSACSSSLEKYLSKQEGIDDALVNLVMATASISYEEDKLNIDDLNKFVIDAGFKSLGEYDETEDNKKDNKKGYLLINGLLAIIVLYISMSHMVGLPVIPFLNMMKYPINYSICLFIFTLYFIYFGRDIIINGIKNIKHKSPNMDTLVMLGVMSSFIYSTYNMILILMGNELGVEALYFESCCIILYLIKLGRYIDGMSKEKTKDAIKDLVTITPKTALLKKDDKEVEVSLDMINKGDILVAKPGMKIAVDGVITNGESHFDEAFISGESIPVKKGVGDKIIAGSYNIDGVINYEAKNIGKDSTISEIVRLVVEATNTKAPIARVADKVSSYFVPGIIIIALITFISYLVLGMEFSEAITASVTVLVVACPCALGLATPLAIVVSEGVCAKNGILVKKSETLENASKVDTVIFDKTGTLTYGLLKIAKVFNFSDYSDKELLKLASALESNSTHPIANAFKEYKSDKLVDDFKNIEGLGLSATIDDKKYFIGSNKVLTKLKIKNTYESEETELSLSGNSIVYVVEDNKVIALIGVKDIVRKEARDVVSKLIKNNKNVIMLSGDNENTAKIIAEEIGIKEVIANVLPKEKSEVVKKIMCNNKSVMMVGDGINDAPSLAIADIGVSLNSGTDIAGNSSDVILMNDNLNNIYNLIDISKRTLINIKENLFWAFFYNVCMIPIAIGLLKPFGISMNPMIAGGAMTISSLTVIINALRLKKWRSK